MPTSSKPRLSDESLSRDLENEMITNSSTYTGLIKYDSSKASTKASKKRLSKHAEVVPTKVILHFHKLQLDLYWCNVFGIAWTILNNFIPIIWQLPKIINSRIRLDGKNLDCWMHLFKLGNSVFKTHMSECSKIINIREHISWK